MSKVKDRCPTCGKAPYFGPIEHGLTARQWAVAEGIYAGKAYKEIASDLNLDVRTVKAHAHSLHKAWGVCSKVQVMLKMIEIKRAKESA